MSASEFSLESWPLQALVADVAQVDVVAYQLAGWVGKRASRQRQACTEQNRDALCFLAQKAETDMARRSIAMAIFNITSTLAECQLLFGTQAVCDALCLLAELSKNKVTLRWIASAVCNITKQIPSQWQFGTERMRDALCALAERKHRGALQLRAASAICNITSVHAKCQRIFGTERVRDALCVIGLNAKSDIARGVIANAMCSVTNNQPENKRLFETTSVRDALCEMRSHTLLTQGIAPIERAQAALSALPAAASAPKRLAAEMRS